MGLPEVKISFSTKSTNAIKRSAQGVVLLILEDLTSSVVNTITEFKDMTAVIPTDWTTKNLELIEQTFMGSPSKIICVRKVPETSVMETLKSLQSKRFNYLAMPSASDEDMATIATWIKSRRTDDKTVKAVLSNQAADHEAIVNFTTNNILVGEKTFSASDYTGRIAGILAGVPFTQSATYYVLNEVTGIESKEDANAAIDGGELILIDDGEKIKIGRGVNSLVTLKEEQGNQWKKIKIMEIFDMIKDDIRDTFNNSYVGKVPNIYDNQVLFITEVNNYFKNLEEEQILDNKANNSAWIDVVAQRKAWKEIGSVNADLEDDKLKEMSFESSVFLSGSIKAVDATEDLKFNIAS